MGGGCGGGFEFAYHVYEPNGTGERPSFEDVPVASLPYTSNVAPTVNDEEKNLLVDSFGNIPMLSDS